MPVKAMRLNRLACHRQQRVAHKQREKKWYIFKSNKFLISNKHRQTAREKQKEGKEKQQKYGTNSISFGHVCLSFDNQEKRKEKIDIIEWK